MLRKHRPILVDEQSSYIGFNLLIVGSRHAYSPYPEESFGSIESKAALRSQRWYNSAVAEFTLKASAWEPFNEGKIRELRGLKRYTDSSL